jgi:hypothetical protein
MIFFVVADPREAGGVLGRTKSDVERSINWREAFRKSVELTVVEEAAINNSQYLLDNVG